MKLAVLALLAAGVAVVFLTPIRDQLSLEAMRALIARMQDVWYAPILFVLIFAVASVLFVPASVFVIPAALIWGWKLGFLYSMAGALIGALSSFAIARYVGDGGILHRFGERGAKIAKKLDHAGFKTILILRMVPFWPFPALNYGAGLAGVKYRDYLAGTALGLCPGVFIVSFSADALVSGTMTGGQAFQRLLLLGALVGAMIMIPSLFRKRAARTLHLEEEVDSNSPSNP